MPALSNQIPTWSFSRLDVYETCPYRAYLAYIRKSPEPPRICPPHLDEHPLDRGIRVHKGAEDFITKNIELISDLESFHDAFHDVRDIYRCGYHASTKNTRIKIEHEWAFRRDWSFTGWFEKDVWGRAIIDLLIIEPNRIRIIDFKTGKKYPLKHIQQGQLYTACTALKYPDHETFQVEFWYLDSGETLEKTYNKVHAAMFRDDFEHRANAMTTATTFPVHPGPYQCRFCPYNKTDSGTGACDFAYDFDSKKV